MKEFAGFLLPSGLFRRMTHFLKNYCQRFLGARGVGEFLEV
jgi:hypothetical protein